jgi:hypothetical protein
MSLLADIRLTPDIEAELRRAIDAAPDEELAALARTDPAFLTGGFRPGHAAALRTRVFQIAAGPQPLSDALRRFLVRHTLNRPLVGTLAAAAIIDLRHELAALFGGARLLLGMLVDERAEVRDAAGRWLRQEPLFSPAEPAAAAARLRDVFGRLLEGAGAAAGGATPASADARRDAAERAAQELRDVRAENRRLKGVEERLTRNREQLAQRERELAALEERRAAAETQARAAGREREEARAELAREVARREERVRAGVEARLATEAAEWLAPARAAAAAASAPAAAADDLLARAASALEWQVAADRHSGNRAALAGRLDAVAGRLAQVRDALAQALHVAPELTAVERDLAAEADRLRQLLGRPAEAAPLEEALAARFAHTAPAALPAQRALVERLAAFGVLDEAAAGRLVAVLQRRQAIAAATAPAAPDKPDPSDKSAPDAPPAALRRALAGRNAAVLLVDGHNVLFGLQGRYLPAQGGATVKAASRDRLVADLARLAGGRPACRVWIVFDGPTRAEQTPAPNVRVTYSGGEGENRADGVLLDNIRFFRGSGDLDVLLATNDQELGNEARRLGARTLSALDLGNLLGP